MEESVFELIMAERFGKTKAEDYYFTAPYKIGLPQTPGKGQKVVMMMASAGLLKGDRAVCRIICKDNTVTEITDQSYTKVFDTEDGKAVRETTITVGDGAVLDYHPCPIIPYANSTFFGSTRIDLKATAALYFSEIMAVGRIAMGEKFAFRQFENRVQISIEGRPVYLEFNRMIPKMQLLDDFFYFDGMTHQGTFYYYCPESMAAESFREQTDSLIDQYIEKNQIERTEVLYGVTEAREGVVWKILSNQAQNIEDIFALIRQSIQNH